MIVEFKLFRRDCICKKCVFVEVVYIVEICQIFLRQMMCDTTHDSINQCCKCIEK